MTSPESSESHEYGPAEVAKYIRKTRVRAAYRILLGAASLSVAVLTAGVIPLLGTAVLAICSLLILDGALFLARLRKASRDENEMQRQVHQDHVESNAVGPMPPGI